MSEDNSLPQWEMSAVYPALDSQEFREDCNSVIRSIQELSALFDLHNINRQESVLLGETTIQVFETVLEGYNATSRLINTPGTYLYCLTTANSNNQEAQAQWSEFMQQYSLLWQLDTRLTAWIGSMDIEALIERSDVGRENAFILRKMKERAVHLMIPEEEALAAQFDATGSSAWTALYNNITTQLLVSFKENGEMRDLSMSALRKLAYEADRELRRTAYETEMAAWQQSAFPLISALNSIEGERIMLSQLRGWKSPLEAALAENNIDDQTLDALMASVQDFFPDLRRYLRAKAHLLGLPTLAWYDINAPISATGRTWPFAQAQEFIEKQFGLYSPKLGGLAKRAFREGWIDAQTRPGKIEIGFTNWLRQDESRVSVCYKPVFYEVVYLAHELGHAYHNLILADRTFLQRQTPITLAESASGFCQTLIMQAGVDQASEQEQLATLDASMQFLMLIIVDTTTWFMFEKSFCEKRKQRVVSLEEAKVLMLDIQRQVYGDALDSNCLHPFTWAAWPHMFLRSFYNFQYPFGTLFAMGLYAWYRNHPAAFKPLYDNLLASTGLESPAALVAPFEMDIRSPAFWRASLDLIRGHIDRFETLAYRAGS